MSDWVITSREKVKYAEQFKSLKPNNGMVTGAQAKGFFLQSQLPPLVLGQIWSLADTDYDGKMDLNEFSIACKLINLKLRGFEIPKALPPTLISSLSAVGVTPTITPTAGMSPLDPLVSLNRPSVPPMIPPQPVLPPHAVVQPMISSIPPMIPPQPLISAMQNQPLIGVMPLSQSYSQQPIMQQLIQSGGPPIIPPQPLISMGGTGMVQSLIDTGIQSPPLIDSGIVLPAGPTPPQSGTPSRTMSISERAPSIESPNSGVEWAIKGPAKLKYTQLFNTIDKNRTGFLTGVQARGLMIQTKLPQAALAQIWALSDMDSDGRLGCDEFVLAMYLCDMARQGEQIPNPLPLEMIPPAFRKTITSSTTIPSIPSATTSRHGSITGSSRHGSISSQSGGALHNIIDADPTAGLPGQTSFEDKRKENFDKGQAELERRRKTLQDTQRKEQEERERKEREEYEKREKARLEIEHRKQQEMERQLQRQKEIEMEKEEQRKRALEQKETARKESERQRQLEWENQRIQEMQLQRQREQEKVLKLKANNQTLNVEVSTLNEKIKELSQKICDTRSGVTNVKTVIDGMRSTRDTQMTDLGQLKNRIKEQNQKLVQLSQEKTKLDAKNKQNQMGGGGNDQDQMTAAFSNKQIILKQLKDKLEDTKEQVISKMSDIQTNDQQLMDLKSQLTELINSCEELYSFYDLQRNQVIEIKINRKNESYTAAWVTSTSTTQSSGGIDTNSSWPVDTTTTSISSPQKQLHPISNAEANDGKNYKYRALYEFIGRNEDEISFQPGDVIMVPADIINEPGWLTGTINGLTGWFPETYVEKIDSPTDSNYTTGFPQQNDILDNKRQLEGIVEVVETSIPVAAVSVQDEIVTTPTTYNNNGGGGVGGGGEEGEYYVSCYPYESVEIGDLTFGTGEVVMVTKKDGDWWTGVIGNRTGIFPSNYVQKSDVTIDNNYVAATTTTEYKDDITLGSYNNGNNDYGGGVTSSPIQQTSSYQTSPLVNEMKSITLAAADEAKTQAEACDSEVSQINTQPTTNDIVQEYARPMSTSSTTPSLRSKKGEIAQVIAPYEATSTEQLTLTRGQLIMIRKKTDSGWWEGELQAKGRRKQVGWFPATYVKILQGGRNSGRNTPVSGARVEMSEQVLDKVIALFPYKALNDDELSFEKDDIISVTGRDEPEWWRGELNGITGLFPSNYVGPFVTSGMA